MKYVIFIIIGLALGIASMFVDGPAVREFLIQGADASGITTYFTSDAFEKGLEDCLKYNEYEYLCRVDGDTFNVELIPAAGI